MTATRAADDGRDETRLERLDRNTIELLAVGLTGIMVLISDLLFGGAAAVVAGVAAAAVIGGLWFALPLKHRREADRSESLHPGRSG